MKVFHSLIALFIFCSSFAQLSTQAQYDAYFSGKNFVCDNSDPEIKELMKLGLDCFQFESYYNAASNVFLKVIGKDSTNCDAYFLLGYSLRLQNKLNEATVFYYVADSLSGNKSYVFKQNLAFAAMAIGATDMARKKYTEMTQYFPESPEGYYGIALTSLELKDYDNGLKNADIAISKYESKDKGAFYVKGMLLTLKGNHDDALPYLEKVRRDFKKDDNFNAAYSICLYTLGSRDSDKKKLKEAGKIRALIEDKEKVIPELSEKLTF